MDRRRGVEAMYGIGNGLVSEVGQKLLEKAEDLCRKGHPLQAMPYLEAALQENPENLDAAIQSAYLCDIEGRLKILQKAERVGKASLKRRLSPDCFEDGCEYGAGHFWGILETRPYMRVMQNIARTYYDKGDIAQSADTIIEMLRLCPGDNMGQRTMLASLLVRLNRNSDALFFSQVWLAAYFSKTDCQPSHGGPAGTLFEAPETKPIPRDYFLDLCRSGDGTFLHTAALASFRLYGDCELSRQYLQAAVMVQPNVLLKVLARVRQAKNPNRDPRSHNGPEEAHDYLWLTQDLWMEPAVWEWADKIEDVKCILLQKCHRERCSKKETSVAEFKRCASCHKPRYCSKECQAADWPDHKGPCKAHQRYKASFGWR